MRQFLFYVLQTSYVWFVLFLIMPFLQFAEDSVLAMAEHREAERRGC